MLLIYSGEDSFTSYSEAKQAAQKLAETEQKPLEIIDVDESDINDLLQKVQSVGLFASGNVVLAKRLFDNTKATNFLENNWEKMLDWPLIIWQEGKLDKRKKVVKQLIDQKRVKEFQPEKPWQIEEWLQRQLEDATSQRVSKTYVLEIIERVGLDKLALSQEIEKIRLYFASRQTLPQPSILLSEGEGDIWKFLDALSNGKRGTALDQFEKLLNSEEGEQYLIAMLARELQLMTDVVQAKNLGKNVNSLGLHPFVLEKTQKKAARFSLDKLQKLTAALLRLDLAIKRGEVEPRVALTLYLLSW